MRHVPSDRLPEILTEVPGPRSRAYAERLARVECPEVTCQTTPLIFWDRATGSNVFDVDGNCYVDLMAGFGVAAVGYAHPEIAEVTARQASILPHAMGDVYPARLKVELLEALERVLPGDLGSAILSSSGSDAVESALKTAQVVTGRSGVIAFEGAYHGLGFGALDATHRTHFRAPFESSLPHRTRFVPYGDVDGVRRALQSGEIGAILVEPIQGRGGIRVPPRGFLPDLRAIATENNVLLIADEVYTGLGRTGTWLACEDEGVLPDVVAIGKALGSGFPISACAGRREVMAAWAASTGEAVHTSTHLGSPMGCAIALRVLELLERDCLLERARDLGERALERLRVAVGTNPLVKEVRGRGLMLGIELTDPLAVAPTLAEALRSGWILLGEGQNGRVLSLSPPLTIGEDVLNAALGRIAEILSR